MTQYDAFIQAINENPDDAALRLIYADWLDEHDEPIGEFLRLLLVLDGRGNGSSQAEALHRLRELHPEIDPEWTELMGRLGLVRRRPLWETLRGKGLRIVGFPQSSGRLSPEQNA